MSKEEYFDPETMRRIEGALASFSFNDYGFDELGEAIKDPDLDIAKDLAEHIFCYLEG